MRKLLGSFRDTQKISRIELGAIEGFAELVV